MKESLFALAAKNGKPRKFRHPKRKKINEKGTENSNSIVKCYDRGIVGYKRPDSPNKKEGKASEKTRQMQSTMPPATLPCLLKRHLEANAVQ